MHTVFHIGEMKARLWQLKMASIEWVFIIYIGSRDLYRSTLFSACAILLLEPDVLYGLE